MFADLCKNYRSRVAFVITICLACHGAFAQKISYSAEEINDISGMQTYVTGRVSSNIIIWKYIPLEGTSQVLIYDENMQLIKREKANVFASGDVYQFNVINRQKSFDVIAQVFTRHKYYCQLASFDGDGQLLQPVKTLVTFGIEKKYYGYRRVIVSDNKKYLALVGNQTDSASTAMQFTCLVYDCGDSVKNIINKTFAMPYYGNSGATFSSPHIDNAGNIFVAEYISQHKYPPSHVILYKSAAFTNKCSSNVIDIANINLGDIDIKVNNHSGQCIVYGLGYRGMAPTGFKQGAERNFGIFSWVVNVNAYSDSPNISYDFNVIKVSREGEGENLSTKDIITLTDNSYTVALTGATSLQHDLYYDYANVFNNGNYSPGFFEAQNPQVYQTGPAAGLQETYADGYNNVMEYAAPGNKPLDKTRWGKIVPPPSADNDDLYLLRLSNKDSGIVWRREVNSCHEENAFAFVNKYSLLNTGGSLHFFCKKILPKYKKTFEEIIVSPEGEITIKPVMTYNPAYDILIDQGVQIGDNSIVFPCVFNGSRLAFVKFDTE